MIDLNALPADMKFEVPVGQPPVGQPANPAEVPPTEVKQVEPVLAPAAEPTKKPETVGIEVRKEEKPPENTNEDDAPKGNAKWAAMRVAAKEAEAKLATEKNRADENARKVAEYEAKIAQAEANGEDASLDDIVGRVIAKKEIESSAATISESEKAIANNFQDRKQVYLKKAAEAIVAIPDYKTVVEASVYGANVTEEIFDPSNLDQSAEIAYYLAKNPQTLAALNAQSRLEVAREITAIKSKISLGKSTVKKTSDAPPPTNALTGGGGNTIKGDENKTMDELAEEMRAYDKTHF